MVFVGDQAAPAGTWPVGRPGQRQDAGHSREAVPLHRQGRQLLRSWFRHLKPTARARAGESEARRAACRSRRGTSTSPSRAPTRPRRSTRRSAQGKHLLFTPGIYHLDSALEIKSRDTVVMGLGLRHAGAGPTAPGADDRRRRRRHARRGSFCEAGANNSRHARCRSAARAARDLTPKTRRRSSTSTAGSEAPSRASPRAASRSTAATSSSTICWLWRADHGAGADWTGTRA